MLTYSWHGDVARYQHRLATGSLLTVQAAEIRRERGHVYARVHVQIEGHTLAWSTIATDSDPDRVRLTNSAHRRLQADDKAALPDSDLKQILDVFCEHLWDAYTGRNQAQPLHGLSDMAAMPMRLEPYIQEQGGHILFSLPGRGKSYTALLKCVSIDAGCSALWPVRQARCLFVNLERSRLSMRRRLTLVNLALGLEPERPLLYLDGRGHTLKALEGAIKRSVDRHGVEVVFLDSISRTGVGKLIEDQTGTAVVDILNGLAPCWYALAHTPRDDDSHPYGSIQFDAGEDVGIRLSSQERDGRLGVKLEIVKANDIPRGHQQVLAYEFDGYGLIRARRANPMEFPDLEAGNEMPLHQQIADYLANVGWAPIAEIADALGTTYGTVAVYLSRFHDRFVRRREGRRILYAPRYLEGGDEV